MMASNFDDYPFRLFSLRYILVEFFILNGHSLYFFVLSIYLF